MTVPYGIGYYRLNEYYYTFPSDGPVLHVNMLRPHARWKRSGAADAKTIGQMRNTPSTQGMVSRGSKLRPVVVHIVLVGIAI